MESKLLNNVESISNDELIRFIKKANQAYFNKSKVIVSDHIYDMAIDLLEERDPNNPMLKTVGNSVSKNKVELPYFMGSMNKFKDQKKIDLWLKKYDESKYIITDKLDGISALYIHSKEPKLYSRGNGSIGQDISSLLKFIDMPKSLEYGDVFRGELIVTKEYYSKCCSSNYASSRSVVNSLVALKDLSKNKIKLDFVVFEFISENTNLEKQLLSAQKKKMKVVEMKIYSKNEMKTTKLLKEILLDRKSNSKYDIDGIIIGSLAKNYKNESGNPDYSFAFKSNGLGKITKVVNVEWNVSKHGKIIPRIQFNTVELNNSKVSWASGIHGQYIKENNIDVGATIRVVLSGDVIPKVVDVIIPSKTYSMPSVPYTWDSVNVVSIDNENNQTFRINHFFQVLKLKGCAKATVEKLVENGFDTLDKFYKMKVEDIIDIDGFQIKSASTLVSNIKELFSKTYDNALIAYASMCFGDGIGFKKLQLLENEIHHFHTKDLNYDVLENIPGYSFKTSEKILSNVDCYREFLDEYKFIKINKEKKTAVEFTGKKYVFSGFRNNDLKDKLKQSGNKVVDTLTKSVDYLVVLDKTKVTSKVTKAKAYNIAVLSLDEITH